MKGGTATLHTACLRPLSQEATERPPETADVEFESVWSPLSPSGLLAASLLPSPSGLLSPSHYLLRDNTTRRFTQNPPQGDTTSVAGCLQLDSLFDRLAQPIQPNPGSNGDDVVVIASRLLAAFRADR